MRLLIVVDMQNDFIDGVLGTPEAAAIVPNVVKKIEEYRKNGDRVMFTKDTHFSNYLETMEGKYLPIPHCIKNTHGWEITDQIEILNNEEIVEKNTFTMEFAYGYDVESVELIGLCTDICVICNALCEKNDLKNTPIYVDANCCAGTTPEKHEAALSVMESCQIIVLK